MQELNNAQRRCFALPPVLESWTRVAVTPDPYDRDSVYAYLDGQRITKVVRCNDALYQEYSVNALVSEDGTMLLPATAKGKPQRFTVAQLEKRAPVGMGISFARGNVSLTNHTTDQTFYCSYYEGLKLDTAEEFEAWVQDWCANTGAEQLAELDAFALAPKKRQRVKAGDFFRYRINRRLYGYGRILLDYDKLRKENVPFWDVFMGKPLCVAVYHIATEDKGLSPAQLCGKPMLPSQMIMDNIFYYGECEVVGNMPLTAAEEDYTVHYGRSVSAATPELVHYQRGRLFVTLKGEPLLYGGFRNNRIGFSLNVKLPILTECIKAGNNAPYWALISPHAANIDLRNPKFCKELADIEQQVKNFINRNNK